MLSVTETEIRVIELMNVANVADILAAISRRLQSVANYQRDVNLTLTSYQTERDALAVQTAANIVRGKHA